MKPQMPHNIHHCINIEKNISKNTYFKSLQEKKTNANAKLLSKGNKFLNLNCKFEFFIWLV